jgi:pimeloyl-ACP methyl ester carboxylesterase
MTTASSTGRIETLNGVQLYFEVHGTGDPVLLRHGFMGCSQDWLGLIHGEKLSPSTTELPAEWSGLQLILPDLRGHGRSSNPSNACRFREVAADLFALLDHLGIRGVKGIGVSGGGNALLHMATQQPERVSAMVLVSATSYFPAAMRPMMRQFAEKLPEVEMEKMRRRHPGGDAQIATLLSQLKVMADTYDDISFTPPQLATIAARTLIVQGDRDPFYPLEISVEMARAIPNSSLWIVPNAGHGPIGAERWPQFAKTALSFLQAAGA